MQVKGAWRASHLLGSPDFEEVIERGIAVASQGVFIFQILKKQHTMPEFQFQASDRYLWAH